MYTIKYTKAAVKDIPKLKAAHLDSKAKLLIDLIRENPYQTPPSYEKLIGNLQGLFSRRINLQYRLVYEVYENEKVIKIISMWTHYERI
ncbi:Txe/YoeB family addiction module toxin [Megasphaera hexanoica]|nr:Txe/YoeB family addiction module toxin [Megasphaera hexanoica]